MAQVVRHVLSALACFQEVYGDGVAQTMDRAAFDAYLFHIQTKRREKAALDTTSRSAPES